MIANRPMYRQTAAKRRGQLISGLAPGWPYLQGGEGIVGCTASDSHSEVKLGEVIGDVDLRQTLVAERPTQLASINPNPKPAGTEPVRLIVPPDAREAVVEARSAMQAKQWDRLRSLIPQADRDPVLGSYVRYWSLRQRLQDPTQPIPEAEIAAFFEKNADAYLADRLKGEWIVAAGRAGDYQRALQLGPVVVENASIRCTLLMAEHLAGRKVRPADAVEAFAPTSACWSMLDQFYERRVVGWSEMQELLRASLETNRSGTSRRFAAIMFDGAQMRHYSAIMDNPRKWLEGRPAPKSTADMELTAIALSRLAYGDKRLPNAAWVESTWESSCAIYGNGPEPIRFGGGLECGAGCCALVSQIGQFPHDGLQPRLGSTRRTASTECRLGSCRKDDTQDVGSPGGRTRVGVLVRSCSGRAG